MSGAQAAPVARTAGVDALAGLSAADLDIHSARGAAFLRRFFSKGGADECARPTSTALEFDSQCNWYPDPEGEDIWPELMVAIRHGHIVSAVTSEPRRLPARLWICTGERGQAATCYPRSIDAATRQRWSGQWRAFFNATN